MRIGILTADRRHELSRGGTGDGGHLDHSLDRLARTVAAVREALEADGHRTVAIPVDMRLVSRLARTRPDLVFNTYFGPARRQDQAHVASLMELAGIPFSGGDAACHFVGLSKPRSKQVFAGSGLPTPRFFVVDDPADVAGSVPAGMSFPLIVKTPSEGEGIGLDARSVVRSREELADAAARVARAYRQPALVEEFMPGREFTVGVLDGATPQVLPILEIILGGGLAYSWEAKTGETAQEVCPAELPADTAAEMGRLAVLAGRAIGCRDYWRVDFRDDARGAPMILEVNTLPGLQPGYSDITRMTAPAGLSYADLVRRILGSALRRR